MPIPYQTVSLTEAELIVKTSLAAALAGGDDPVAAAVVDAGGALLALGRLDAAPGITAGIAENKARTAVMFRQPTDAVFAHVSEHPQIGVSVMAVPGLSILPGALPIVVDGACVGAVGVAGGRRDQEWAAAGIDAAFPAA